ncbi:ubiquitin fusion degradation protein UFD1-domain-containing protein [Sparassis latifolia]
MGRPPARAYDEYLRAYSAAMLPGKERDNVSYGGKIIMPPSTLARLTSMDLESPWMFKLRNPANPAASTHAGVLEFIAEEGCVHLPQWMMSTLRLNEGDPIRITGAELPKGNKVKLQAQSVHFLEVSDPKAVLEQALRHFSVLTQGDIIEILYNGMVFGFLVMETYPGGEGISVLDTDLEVDFAAPLGYVEPERPKPAPPATMATKLNINLNDSSPGSSRPSSSLAGTFAPGTRGTTVSKGGEQWESFKGKGETLLGRKTKGKGISHRRVQEVADNAKIVRTDKARIVTNDTLDSDVPVPAPLNLPFGQLFFGFNVPPFTPPASNPSATQVQVRIQAQAFSGAGNTLAGPSSSQGQSASSPSPKGKSMEEEGSDVPSSWGVGGQRLGSRTAPRPAASSGPRGAGGAIVPVLPQRSGRQEQRQKERSPSPDWGVDDDDVIIIDSDSD